jgi:hypothetical protein
MQPLRFGAAVSFEYFKQKETTPAMASPALHDRGNGA